jgi:hypothetical protein
MVQIDIPAAFVASQLMLDLGRDAIKAQAAANPERPSPLYYRYLTRTLLFAGVVIAPAGIYLLAGWPGWEQLYWTERVEQVIFQPLNALLPALFVLAIVVAGWAGHVIGYNWLVSGKEKYLRPTYLGLLGLVAAVVLSTHPAFLLVGTYQQYHHDRGAMGSVWSNPHDFGLGWCGVMVYFALAFVWLVWRTRKDARESQPWPLPGKPAQG